MLILNVQITDAKGKEIIEEVHAKEGADSYTINHLDNSLMISNPADLGSEFFNSEEFNIEYDDVLPTGEYKATCFGTFHGQQFHIVIEFEINYHE